MFLGYLGEGLTRLGIPGLRSNELRNMFINWQTDAIAGLNAVDTSGNRIIATFERIRQAINGPRLRTLGEQWAAQILPEVQRVAGSISEAMQGFSLGTHNTAIIGGTTQDASARALNDTRNLFARANNLTERQLGVMEQIERNTRRNQQARENEDEEERI